MSIPRHEQSIRRASRRPTGRPAAAIATQLALLLAVATGASAGAPALDSPPTEALAEARAIVAAMEASSRGPYSRIRWFCKDGTVLPPTAYACSTHGGGRQHGEYSEARQRLAALGWPVGTVLAATSWEEMWDSRPRQARLRDLPLERYLIDVADGWVMRGARTYRGHVQVENEERAGRALLLRLLDDREWSRDNYLLVRELTRVLPHGGSEDRLRGVRRVSQEIAERAPSFEPLRIEIHTRAGASSAVATREWITRERGRVDPALLERAAGLADDLDALYGASKSAERLETARASLARIVGGALIAERISGPATDRVARLGTALRMIRDAVGSATPSAERLLLLDLAIDVENELLATSIDTLTQPGQSRQSLMKTATHLLDAVYGAGLLSARERDALTGPLAALDGQTNVATERYQEAVRSLRRCGDWAAGTVRFHFGEALARFGALEPVAHRFVDDLLRASALLHLAEVQSVLSLDADIRSGLTHRLFGDPDHGVLGLNPGVARGRLRIVRPGDLARGMRVARDEIVVLPETVSELDPVAGILSLSAGNLLSHVQLLARNLGIPNATLPPRLQAELERYDGQDVFYAVGPRGSVFLSRIESVPADLAGGNAASRDATPRILLDPPQPQLDVREPMRLAELHAGLSGSIVGPKAANLGELARTFPGRVSPAIAIPFGIFADHMTGDDQAPRRRLDRAFVAFRGGEIDRAALDAEVEQVRQAIRTMTLTPTAREKIVAAMRSELGADGSYGVFVRSDTNVEDLPGFTGAGLNETVPNVVGLDAQLAAIPRVWSSPFTQRAMGWRGMVLSRPEEVYTSVLLQRSVPADKSGVLVTSDLDRRSPGLTVAMAHGVGGAVDGEAAEQIAITEDGTVRLLAEAKAPYRRRLKAAGGVDWVPATAGAVLTPSEIQLLRAFASELHAELEPAQDADGNRLPWDVELGFVDGRLMLFQVRPLVERGDAHAERVVERLIPSGRKRSATTRLDQPPEVPERSSS